MTVEHEVLAALAQRYAATVDRSARDGDAAGLLRAGDKLVELLGRLPVRVEKPVGGAAGVGDDDDVGRSAGGALLRVLDGAPSVGDAAHG